MHSHLYIYVGSLRINKSDAVCNQRYGLIGAVSESRRPQPAPPCSVCPSLQRLCACTPVRPKSSEAVDLATSLNWTGSAPADRKALDCLTRSLVLCCGTLLSPGATTHPGADGPRRRSNRRHACMRRVQATQLSDEQIEAQRPEPAGAAQVLPLVRASHSAPGDAVTACTWSSHAAK